MALSFLVYEADLIRMYVASIPGEALKIRNELEDFVVQIIYNGLDRTLGREICEWLKTRVLENMPLTSECRLYRNLLETSISTFDALLKEEFRFLNRPSFVNENLRQKLMANIDSKCKTLALSPPTQCATSQMVTNQAVVSFRQESAEIARPVTQVRPRIEIS